MKLKSSGFTTPCLFILNKKYNTLKSRKLQISEKENSAREIARYTHLLLKLPAPAELAATESMIFKEKIKKNVYLISYLT